MAETGKGRTDGTTRLRRSPRRVISFHVLLSPILVVADADIPVRVCQESFAPIIYRIFN
jgi:hypothetical protein